MNAYKHYFTFDMNTTKYYAQLWDQNNARQNICMMEANDSKE